MATPHPAYDPSSKTTQDEVIQTSADQITGLIQDRISDQTGEGDGGTASLTDGTNKAAGSGPMSKGLWVNASAMQVRDTHTGANYDGPIWDLLVGFDTKLSDQLLVGIAAGYERIDIDTGYNSGSLTGNSWTIAPYAAFQINKMLSVNATIGHTWASYDEDRPGASGSTDGDRWFGSANLVAKEAVNQWRLTENLGYFYVTETQDAYNESGLGGVAVAKSTRHLGQVRAGGKVGYYMPTIYGYLEPYVSGRAEYDVDKSSDIIISSGTTVSRSDFGATFGAGLNVGVGDGLVVSGEVTSTAFRNDYQAYGASATVAFKF
ncbi:MAG TPA: autotransporter outer membrane beta-barrel domain-containing protein [Parvibaculum sp.]